MIHVIENFIMDMLEKWFSNHLRSKFEWDPLRKINGSWWICVLRREEIEFIYSYTQNGIRVNEKLMLKVCPLEWNFVGKLVVNVESHIA